MSLRISRARAESLLLRIRFASLFCILTLAVQVQHGDVTAEDNEVIKLDLGFQVCCLLSITKREKGKKKKVGWQHFICVFYKCVKL